MGRVWLIIAVTAVVGCGGSGGGKTGDPDAGSLADGGPGGTPDGGPGDGGSTTDGGSGDGGTFDGGTLDGGPGDAGPDGGVPDGGVDGGQPTDVLRWTTLEDRPEGTSEAQGAVIGDKLYTFGGFDWSAKQCCTPTRRAYVFDATSDQWARLPDMPEGFSHAGTTTDGSDIYFAGGFVEDPSRTYQTFGTVHAWKFQVATGTYEALPDLPAARGAGTLAYLDGKLHFIGGLSAGQASDTDQHWVLDLAGGATTWSSAAALPTPRNHLGSAVFDGKIYVIGGQHSHDAALVTVPDVELYDPASDSWSRGADMPRARSHIAGSTFVFGGRILVLAGEIRNEVSVAEVAAYDPRTDAWTELTPMPAGRFSGVAGPILDGFVYTTGAYQQTTFYAVPVD